MPSRGQQLGKLLNPTGDIVETSLPPKIETFSHWACGSIDRLICQILKEPGNYNENNITESFKAVLKWHDELNEYPIADENDYLNNLHDECVDYIENKK